MNRLRLIAVLLGLSAFSAAAQDADRVDFHTQVAPILSQHCFECHGDDQSKGGFSLNTRALFLDAEAADPGNAAESLMIELILDPDPEFAMPPASKPRLSAEEIAVLRQWIDQGLTWEEGFTFATSRYEPPLQPRRPELPEAVDGRTNPIDRIIDAYLTENELTAPAQLGDAAFYRRLSLDLHGTLPDPEALDRFVADNNPAKRDLLVDALLADDVAYARHWLTFWNDHLRNDYRGTGYIDGGRRSISDWLYRSLLENKPYDQFTRELLAPTQESEGFIRGIQWRGNVNASQTREIQFAQNVGQVFLGINLKCASCHDSFIDNWTLAESYGLAAVYSDHTLELYRCDVPTGVEATPSWLFPEIGTIDPQAPRDERLQQLAALMTSPQNGRLTRTISNRLWQRMMGRGIVHPVDAMQTEPWSEDLLDQIAIHLSDEHYDLKAVLRLIATSHAYQSQTLAIAEEPATTGYQYAGPLVKRMTAEQFVDAIRQVTQTPTTNSANRFNPAALEQAAGVRAPDNTTRAVLNESDLLQRALGRPNREQVVTSRPEQLTTLVALDLANGEALNNLIRAGAARLIELHHSLDRDALIDLVFRRALSRLPSDAERAVCRDILGDAVTPAGVEDLLWSVFMLPEFQHAR